MTKKRIIPNTLGELESMLWNPKYPLRGYRSRDVGYILVNGGRNKIRLYIVATRDLTAEMIQTAIQECNRRGWRKAVIDTDDMYGDSYRLANISQHSHYNYNHGRLGIYLGYVEDQYSGRY